MSDSFMPAALKSKARLKNISLQRDAYDLSSSQDVAAQLGHADIRMVEKHYGHLAPNYVADTVRAAFGTLGIIDTDNVVPLTGSK